MLLINANPAGTETLKNLVLPGVGHFTIADAANVKESDLGNNFFITAESLGQSRAQVAARLLLELNPDVKGKALQLDVGEILATAEGGNLDFLSSFSLVIASQLTQGQERRLSVLCTHLQSPLLLLKSVGLLASLRVYAPEHRVVESKPADKEVLDLHMINPFPELRAFADTFDLASLDDMAHAHVPYVVLLVKLLDMWKGQHNGQLPASFADKTAFKATIKAASRNYFNEMNFQEAFNNSYLSYADDTPETTLAILADPKASGNGPSSPIFWTAAEAVASFRAEHGALPLSGALPDMTSTTDSYIQLQVIYQTKAKQDLEQVRAKVVQITGQALHEVDEEFLALFTRNLKTLDLLRYRTLEEELTAALTDDLTNDLDETPPMVEWYVGLRAREVFREREGRYPGQTDYQSDAVQLEVDGKGVATQLGLDPSVFSGEAALEVARYGEAELHGVSALLGGVASQEAVKLITRQFTPINNTFIYSAVRSKGVVYQL